MVGRSESGEDRRDGAKGSETDQAEPLRRGPVPELVKNANSQELLSNGGGVLYG
jgi:hypothetical protein